MSLWPRIARAAGVLALAALVLGLFAAAVLLFKRPPDPAFEGRLASEWADDLLSPDYSTRSEAQAALQKLGEKAVPQLRLMLRRSNGPWHSLAAKGSRWLPFLNYQHRDALLCRQRAAEAVGWMGPKASEAAPELLACLALEGCAAEAERALVRIGPRVLAAMEGALRSRNPEIRGRAAKLLREFPELPASTQRALLNLTRDREPAIRRQAATTLGERPHGASQYEIASALLLLAADASPEVRAAAIEALGKIGGAMPSHREAARSAVRGALADRDVAARLQAAKALWKLERDSAAVLPVLTNFLPTRESWQAAYALAQMGAAAAPAVPGLVDALTRERVPRPYRTPPSSAFALGQIGAVAIPALGPLLQAADARTRLNAVMAIGFMGKSGGEAVPNLLPLLRDNDAEVRNVTALTLAAIGAHRDQMLEGLSACLNAEDIYMRSAAAQVLREIAPEGNWVVNPE